MLTLSLFTAREHRRDLRRAADSSQVAVMAEPARAPRVTLREARSRDASRLRRLAALDCAPAPSGRALIAEVDGDLRAALPLDGGRPIADPFHPGLELLELLRLRAAQL